MIGECERGIPRLQRMNHSQRSSAIVEAMDQYSASALDQATMEYFLALHEIQLLPKNVQRIFFFLIS